MIDFRVDGESGSARAGTIRTPHGEVQTPAFMPVATQATVKSLAPEDVAATGARMFISNTYHLWLRPGPEVIAEHGGLHGFARWPHSIATDSGGFQAFSLAERTKLTDDGFELSSHLDGTRLFLSPEESMRIQGLLGSDIAMQLDVCPAADTPPEGMQAAVATTTRWAVRCLEARRPDQALFGIVQGGTDARLRRRHHDELARLPLDGLALGGFSVGEPSDTMHATLAEVVPDMDTARTRYLMGVGTPDDLVRAIAVGVDLFDCVLPTRNARTSQVFVPSGRLVLKNAAHARDERVIDPDCTCGTCAGGYSRAYLRHLFRAGEMLAHRLLTQHNLHVYGRLMADARAAILSGGFDEWARRRLTVD